MLLLVDENVPQSVAQYFASLGHEVKSVTDLLPAGSPDPLIAVIGDQMSAVIVTWDRDFRSLVAAIPHGSKTAFRKLGRLSFRCREIHGRALAEKYIDEIELAHKKAIQGGVQMI